MGLFFVYIQRKNLNLPTHLGFYGPAIFWNLIDSSAISFISSVFQNFPVVKKICSKRYMVLNIVKEMYDFNNYKINFRTHTFVFKEINDFFYFINNLCPGVPFTKGFVCLKRDLKRIALLGHHHSKSFTTCIIC